jgi:serine protease
MSAPLRTSGMFARLAVLFAALACAGGSIAAGGRALPKWGALARTSDQLIVRFRDGTPGAQAEDAQTLAQLHAAAARAGVRLRVLHRNWNNAMVLKLDRHLPDEALQALAREIREADADVQFAEPDRIKRIAAVTPNDPQYPQQWHYYETTAGINLPSAWSLTNGAGVVVAVLDTGYRRHVDLVDNMVGGYDFISDSANARDGDGRDSVALDPGDWTNAGDCGDGADAADSSWHGTHVAGTIAAVTNNGVGVAGVAYGAQILPVRVLGKCGGYDSDIADGIVWAAGGSVAGVPANQHPARVLNLSFVGFGPCTETYQTAIDSARSRGAVVVVAAGNDGVFGSSYAPANCNGVITVAAVERTGVLTGYSNRGHALKIAAPGGDMTNAAADGILSTSNDGPHAPGNDIYAYNEGTSMAAAHVSGVAALMFSRNPSLTPNQVLDRMRSNVTLFPQYSCAWGCGAGIVNAYWSATMATATLVPETEPNDSLETAQPISPAMAVVSGSSSVVWDNDYYKVTLGPGRRIRASVAPTGTTAYFSLALLDRDGHTLRQMLNFSWGQTARVVYDNPGPSTITLYLKVFLPNKIAYYSLSIAH